VNLRTATHREKRVDVSDIDLRSDTVTLPTEEMLRAMTRAPLGDDVFGDDPTVNRLEETAAERMGMKAGQSGVGA
jgi:threonine aldolase